MVLYRPYSASGSHKNDIIFYSKQFKVVKQTVLHFVNYLPNGMWLSIDTFDSTRKELQSLVYLDDDTKSDVFLNVDSNLTKTTNNNVNGLVAALNQAQSVSLSTLFIMQSKRNYVNFVKITNSERSKRSGRDHIDTCPFYTGH